LHNRPELLHLGFCLLCFCNCLIYVSAYINETLYGNTFYWLKGQSKNIIFLPRVTPHPDPHPKHRQ
jgi:hypothetical protein